LHSGKVINDASWVAKARDLGARRGGVGVFGVDSAVGSRAASWSRWVGTVCWSEQTREWGNCHDEPGACEFSGCQWPAEKRSTHINMHKNMRRELWFVHAVS
jgi:hypothetical protein